MIILFRHTSKQEFDQQTCLETNCTTLSTFITPPWFFYLVSWASLFLLEYQPILITQINNTCGLSVWSFRVYGFQLNIIYQPCKCNDSQRTPRSTLPPESTIPMLRESLKAGFCLKLSERTAARPIAPLGSIATLSIS